MTTHAVRIARTELRRKLRSTRSNQTRLALYAGTALFVFLPLLLLGAFLFSIAGEAFASGASDGGLFSVSDAVAGGTAVAILGLTVLVTIRSVTSVANPDSHEPDYLFISTPLRNVVAGLVLREIALLALWLVPPVAIFAAAFAWGASTPLVPVAALALLCVALAVAVPLGFAAGVAIRHLLTVYEPIARYRTILLVLFWGAYFAAVALDWFGNLLLVLAQAFGDSPLGWPGHLLLGGLPGIQYTPWRAVLGVAGATGVGLGALAVGVRLAETHWFADPARTADADETTVESSDRLASVLSGLSQPTRRVTVTTVRRAKRSPIRLAYAAYPLFGGIYLVEQIVRTGRLPVTAAVFLALYVVWASGVLFTLNILGDRGPALESILTSPVSGRAIVAGTVLAGVLVTLPLAVVVPLAAGLVSPLETGQTALLTLGTVVGAFAAPLLATGIGTRFPRFGTVNVTRNKEAVMPSKTAFVLYSLGVGLPIGGVLILRYGDSAELLASILSFLLSLVPRLDVTVPETFVTGLAAVVVVFGIVAPFLSAWDAIRRFDEYRPY
jgi:hypothetical protein